MVTLSAKETVELALSGLKGSLLTELNLGELRSRNTTAYKWKAPFRSLLLREAVHWRLHDLLSQSFTLHQNDQVLGARILLRSAFETSAMLTYLNILMNQVIEGALDFHIFGSKTEQLLLGSRDGSTDQKQINILTVLEHCEKRYPGIFKMFEELSESAHPNYEGMSLGYSEIDPCADVISFSNRWVEQYGDSHLKGIMICIEIFVNEYNKVWPECFQKLESWIQANDNDLEKARKS